MADPPDDLEVRVHTVAGQQHAVVVPRTVQRLSGEAAEVLYEIQRDALEIEKRRDHISELVPLARDLGVSWSAIGWSIGTTPQAAQQRFTDPDD